jgi:ubiquinone/menaquinone biosynthesis C-methylase UbiE
MEAKERYIPALRYDRLTPLYDPLLRWVMREGKFKRHLIDQTQIRAGQRVLDLGCGTATLTIMIKQRQPDTIVVGVDGDEKVLAIGRRKAERSGVGLTLDRGLAFDLPYPDRSFDRVVSSLVLHHLNTEDKRRTLREVYRVLRPSGELHVVDFGKPHNLYTRLASIVTRRLEQAADNMHGLLLAMTIEAGFDSVEVTTHYTTLFGSLSLYRARKSAPEAKIK